MPLVNRRNTDKLNKSWVASHRFLFRDGWILRVPDDSLNKSICDLFARDFN